MTQKKKLKKKKKLGVRNYGLDWAKQEADRKPDQDWKLGASSPKCIAEIPAGQRGQYMPAGERQNIGEEKMDCASRDFANICEAKFNYLVRNNLIPESHEIWLAENGYFTETGIESAMPILRFFPVLQEAETHLSLLLMPDGTLGLFQKPCFRRGILLTNIMTQKGLPNK